MNGHCIGTHFSVFILKILIIEYPCVQVSTSLVQETKWILCRGLYGHEMGIFHLKIKMCGERLCKAIYVYSKFLYVSVMY